MKKKKFSFLIPAAIEIAMGFMACSENYVYEIPKINGKAFNATVVSSNGTTLYGICPKQENGNNQITVRVDSVGEPTVCPNTFKYSKVERVSVLAGKTANGGYTDGSPIDARFNYMYGVGVVTGNNVIVMEGRHNRVRMISEKDNKELTLLTGGPNFGHPAVSADRKRLFAIQIQQPHAIYSFDQVNNWSAKRLATSLQYKDASGNTQTVDGEIYACALDDEGKYLYFRDHKARFGRMEIANPENVEILNDKCGDVDKASSYTGSAANNKNFYQTFYKDCPFAAWSDYPNDKSWSGYNCIKYCHPSDKPGSGGTTRSKMRELIKRERQVEFAIEGRRFFDLRRWGDLASITVQRQH